MEIVHEIGIPATDFKIIGDMLDAYPNEGYGFHLSMLRHVFSYNIKPGHYACLGYLIGERVAAGLANQNLNQILSLCQRHN